MAYIDEIQEGFRRDPRIADYRINLGAGRGASVGIRDNDVGSVYSPTAFADTIGGGFLIQWQDGRLSRGNLDGNSLRRLEEVLDRARAAAYDDPDAAQFLGPQTVHPVPLWSDEIPPLFEERASYLLGLVRPLQDVAEGFEVKTLNGGVSAGIGESWLRTSRGLDLHVASTSFGYSASFDGIIGDGERRRTLIDEAEIVTQIERVGRYLQDLRTPADVSDSRRLRIVLHPNVAYSLFDFYVWGNMSGSAVYHGQSAWKQNDFAEQKEVLRPDLTVRVEPWEPLGPHSFGWTGEGLPSQPITYIDRGRLVQPALDLKYARRLGLPANTPPGGERSIRIEGPVEQPSDEFLAGVDEGVLVLSVLGLHTQDRTSGNYSLSAPQALLIRDGQVHGRVKATLSGNFFDHLCDADLRLVRFAGQHSPGFAFIGSPTFEQV